MLTDAHAYWYGQVAVHCPYVLFGAPTTMVTADGGVTYTFPSDTEPLAVEVYASATGPELKASSFGDGDGDYVWEGSRIRMVTNTARTFTNGPIARWVAPPTTIDGSTAPTLKPARARVLAVYRACALWASAGGLRDPAPFYTLEQRTWLGDPDRGDTGILGELKSLNPSYGRAAWRRSSKLWGFDYVRAARP
jgi:hypothetical protein